MAQAVINLAVLIKKSMELHSEQEGCPWKEGAFEEAVLSPEFSALGKKLKSLEICKTE